jgi:hypothetical protein
MTAAHEPQERDDAEVGEHEYRRRARLGAQRSIETCRAKAERLRRPEAGITPAMLQPGTPRKQWAAAVQRDLAACSQTCAACGQIARDPCVPRLFGARESGRNQVCHEPMRTGQRQQLFKDTQRGFRPKTDAWDTNILVGFIDCDRIPAPAA